MTQSMGDATNPASGWPAIWALIKSSLLSSHRGSSRPSYVLAGTQWIKTISATREEVYYYDGASDVFVLAFNPTTHKVIELASSASDGLADKNAIINGGCQVAQRPAPALSTTMTYGPVDRFMLGVSGGSVSAGAGSQNVTSPSGTTATSLLVGSVTTTGAAVILARTRIEARDAKKFYNQIASFQSKVYHDVGSAINYTTIIRKANAADNFTATTVIATSTATSVPNATSTKLKHENISMGDCRNGIEIEIQAACGAVTTKNFDFAEWQLELGELCTAFQYRGFAAELQDCMRYYEKSYDYATAVGSVSQVGALYAVAINSVDFYSLGGARFLVPKRAIPTLTILSINGASSSIRDMSNSVDRAATVSMNSEKGYRLSGTSMAATAAHGWQHVADAEL